MHRRGNMKRHDWEHRFFKIDVRRYSSIYDAGRKKGSSEIFTAREDLVNLQKRAITRLYQLPNIQSRE